MNAFWTFLICLAATTIGGISGVGGGVIIKPVLDAASGLPVDTISFLSGCTVVSMTVVSLLVSRRGTIRVEKRRGTLLAIGAAAGGLGGQQLFSLIKTAGGSMVSAAQQGMMILLTLGVLFHTLFRRHVHNKDVQGNLPCLGIGMILGCISAFLGIGGGPFNLTVLTCLFSMDTKTAALNSLYLIFFSQSASLIVMAMTGRIPAFDAMLLATMIAGGVAGGIAGRRLSSKLPAAAVQRLFIGLVVAIIGLSVYNLTLI